MYIISDHPRSRGVYSGFWTGTVQLAGSSPLARGLRQQPAEPGIEDRIIPARAGFTSVSALIAALTPDHPRSRGVYSAILALIPAMVGSSPLARGLL